jgi:hypothetical protein
METDFAFDLISRTLAAGFQVNAPPVTDFLLHGFVAQIAVEQVPGGQRHGDPAAAQAARIVSAGFPDLVLQIVRHSVGAALHAVPEAEHEADVIVGLGGPRPVPGDDAARGIEPDLVIAEHVRARAGHGRQQQEKRGTKSHGYRAFPTRVKMDSPAGVKRAAPSGPAGWLSVRAQFHSRVVS